MTEVSIPPLDSHMDINLCTSSVLDHMKSSTDGIFTLKGITTLPNQRPWMNREVWVLQSPSDLGILGPTAHPGLIWRGESVRPSTTTTWGSRSTNYSDPRHMWQGIQAITDYKPVNITPPSSDASLPEEFNLFYGHFDRDNKEVATKEVLPANHQPLTLPRRRVCSAEQDEPPECRWPWWCPRTRLQGMCWAADWGLDRHFQPVASSSSLVVPECLKSTTIVAAPKHLLWLPPSCIYPHRHEVLREAGLGSDENLSTTHTGSLSICLPPE